MLDIGCGEGKNSAPFAQAGCKVDAVDCSSYALDNGKAAFPDLSINWVHADVKKFSIAVNYYDLAIVYGLFHCLKTELEIVELASRVIEGLHPNGVAAICTFNDRSQDLTAHPGFEPILLPHDWYLNLFKGLQVIAASDTDLQEVHKHNEIPHHHSLTRLLARKPNGS